MTGREGGTSNEHRLSVPEMNCPSCAQKVTGALSSVEGVETVSPLPATGTLVVDGDEGLDRGVVVEAVERAGYDVVGSTGGSTEKGSDVEESRTSTWTSPRARKTAIGAVFLVAGLVLEFDLLGGVGGGGGSVGGGPIATLLGVEFALADLLFLGAVATAGQDILKGGWYSARAHSLDIDFLMTAAIASAIGASLLSADATLYSEAATLAVLFSVAELLEDYSMDQARGSLQALIDSSPDEATVLRDGTEATVPVDAVDVGETVAVRPGEKIPLDGIVLSGESAIDESPVTGESVPAEKEPGDEVYAGTINRSGYLEIEVTTESGADTLSKIVTMVEDAQANRTEREQFVDRFAGYYTPLMVTAAILVAAVPPLVFGLSWLKWFVYGITMLVLACPCAFVISTPVTVVSGITSAARQGVLIKGGRHLESMGGVGAIAMDKTGTITKGELVVTDVIPVGDRDEAEVLECARGLEERSEHPIAEAVVDHASENGVSGSDVTDFEAIAGKGVRAELDGDPHYAGNPAFFESLGFDLDHAHVLDRDEELDGEVRQLCDRQGCLNLVEDTIPRLQREGKTIVLVGTETELEGIVAVADEIRPEAGETIERLQSLGLEVVIVTGDNERTARAVAERVGVDDVRAERLPEEKVAAVEALEASYDGGVAMVGDGVNDAPALATASVGIAMGAAGTDAALETADVALMADDLSKLPYLYELARRGNGIIRQNVWASLAMKALLAVGVPFGYVSVALAVLAGDAGMTVGVTGNALRLSRLRSE